MEHSAARTQFVFGQPMAPCPACGSYHIRFQAPIAIDISAEDGLRKILSKWAKARKGGATPLRGPVFIACFDCGHDGPSVDCTGRTSEDVCRDPEVAATVIKLWNSQPKGGKKDANR